LPGGALRIIARGAMQDPAPDKELLTIDANILSSRATDL
jgi:hypothetical protein